ncbi:restriction endonuclease subunit S [Campylobacter fetus]|uniref:restriction endonuclease subunit S n=1 Tax=Campylobacter fetus TaxID=196 RepID=UPI000818755E|nr:restriction endonuclease subunit S [Campylobacter fetus]OCR99314.1 hypothetical protein A9K75_07445 [Campylobacter fetus subsp. testudinum]
MKDYKQTAIGRIPQDWEVKKIKDITYCTAGGTPNTSINGYWNGEIRWMNSGELNKKFVYEVEGRITKLGLEKSSTKILPKNCILIGLAGQGKTRGTVAINYIELCTNQSIGAIYPKYEIFNPIFLYYYLDTQYLELRKISAGDGGRGGLNLKILNNLQIPLPPLKEQGKIAEILSTWDKAISNLDELIAQKQNLKTALMQNLLSAKIRFKEFTTPWQEVKLGDILKEISERNSNNNVDLVLSVTNKFGFVSQTDFFDKQVASKDTSNYKIIRNGDFAYNPSRINIGSIALLKNFDIGILSPMYVVFRCSNLIKNNFIKYWFSSYKFTGILNDYLSGSVRDSLVFRDMKSIKILLPNLAEQQKIAEVLSACDDEINLLKDKLSNLKLQKQGLMQKLLTGKVRVRA